MEVLKAQLKTGRTREAYYAEKLKREIPIYRNVVILSNIELHFIYFRTEEDA